MANRLPHTWLLTWTTKGTWQPGDRRGWVSGAPDNLVDTPLLPENPQLKTWPQNQMPNPPVWLTQQQAEVAFSSFQNTAHLMNWWLGAAAVMPNHVHLVVTVPGDPPPSSLALRFKGKASRELNTHWGKQSWWTSSCSTRILRTNQSINAALEYVANQSGALCLYKNPGPGLSGS